MFYQDLYRLEVRPLTLNPFRKVTIWNSKTESYESFSLKRGKYFTAHQRMSDGRPVFAGGPGTNRLNSKAWVDAQAKAFKKKGFATRIETVQYALFPHLTGEL